MALSNRARTVALYFLPGDTLNEVFPFLLTTYITITTHLRNQAVSDTLNDLQDDEAEEFVSNNTKVNVRSVSNAVMWICRDQFQSNYKTIYIVLLVLMSVFILTSFVSGFVT